MKEKKDPVEVLLHVLFDDDKNIDHGLVIEFTFDAKDENNGTISIWGNSILAAALTQYAITTYNEGNNKRIVCFKSDIPDILRSLRELEDICIHRIDEDCNINKDSEEYVKDVNMLLNVSWLFDTVIKIDADEKETLIDYLSDKYISNMINVLNEMYERIK